MHRASKAGKISRIVLHETTLFWAKLRYCSSSLSEYRDDRVLSRFPMLQREPIVAKAGHRSSGFECGSRPNHLHTAAFLTRLPSKRSRRFCIGSLVFGVSGKNSASYGETSRSKSHGGNNPSPNVGVFDFNPLFEASSLRIVLLTRSSAPSAILN